MKITIENVRRLPRDFGPVGVVDRTGKIQQLNDSSADAWASVDQANTFLFAGSRYSRASFQKLLDRMLASQGTRCRSIRRRSSNPPIQRP
jgi:hypothetical protein